MSLAGHNRKPKPIPPQKIVGWWEDYKCGCVSEVVRRKRDLLGYCGKHGADRRYCFPSFAPATGHEGG